MLWLSHVGRYLSKLLRMFKHGGRSMNTDFFQYGFFFYQYQFSILNTNFNNYEKETIQTETEKKNLHS